VRAIVCAVALSACASVTPLSAHQTTQPEWDDGLARLARLRASFPMKPYTQTIGVDLFEPRSRRHLTGRGAVGVDPGHAMRMILVGPMGGRALDVWVTREAWRMEVPAVHLLRRGGVDAPSSLPIGFFRSWFVDPLGGRPLALGPGGELIVRDIAGGTLRITEEAYGAHVDRRHGASGETFTYAKRPEGDRARYVDHATGLEVDVTLDPIQASPPDPDAFVDPDLASRP
jgi:hypothetical protein